MYHSHVPTSAGRFRLLLLLFLLVATTGCRLFLAPAYEAEIDRQVATTAKLTNRLYLDMLDVPDQERTYDRFAPRYIEIEAEINSLRMQNEARKKNQDMLAMTDTLAEKFSQYRFDHRDKIALSRGEAESYNDYLKDYWKRLLLTERNLHRKNQ